MNTTSESRYTAWVRTSSRSLWYKVGEAGSYDEALDIALDFGRGLDRTVLPKGRDPNTDHSHKESVHR